MPKIPGQQETLADVLLKQNEDSVAFCAGVDNATLNNGYEYQRIAATHGGTRYERWLVTLPALEQRNFLSHLDDWRDYRGRAHAYFSRSLAQRNGDDLALLVAVYAPDDPMVVRPPYHVDDNVTFLALYEIARRNRVVLPVQFEQSADQITAGLTSIERDMVKSRLVQLDGKWRIKDPGRLPHGILAEVGEGSFCE